MKNKIKTYTTVIAGLLLVALSFNLFLSPNNLVAGGVSGASILARELFGIKESVFIYIANFLLVLNLHFLKIPQFLLLPYEVLFCSYEIKPYHPYILYNKEFLNLP